MRDKVINSLAYPVSWPAEQKGMQGGAELDHNTILECERNWHQAAVAAVDVADSLHERGLHKSVINRLLEPFIPHKVIISATEWEGFFDQRLHPDAQPEIHEAAKEMYKIMNMSTPVFVDDNQWHTPYIDLSDYDKVIDADWYKYFETPQDAVLGVSAARCARVSYETHDGVRDIEKDFELYSRLKNHKPAHASPFEHVARPVLEGTLFHRGNFTGWEQARHILGLR
jgi:hypothetical protein